MGRLFNWLFSFWFRLICCCQEQLALDFCRVILCGDHFTLSSFGAFQEPSSAASAGQ